MQVTPYFAFCVLVRRPELADLTHRLEQAIVDPLQSSVQADGRTRCWVYVPESDKYLRVILEPDGVTVHNAFYDRRFRP